MQKLSTTNNKTTASNGVMRRQRQIETETATKSERQGQRDGDSERDMIAVSWSSVKEISL